MAKRDTKTGNLVKAYRKEIPFSKELLALQTCFARNPDLTLEILTLARKYLARYDERKCDTQDSRVRAFLVKFGISTIKSDSGKLRLPKKNEFASGVVKGIPRPPASLELAIPLCHILNFHFVRI